MIEADLLEMLAGDGRNRHIEACHSRAWEVLCHVVQCIGILQWIFEMCKVEAAHAVRLQFDEAWGDDAALEVDCIGRDIAYVVRDLACDIVDDQVVSH